MGLILFSSTVVAVNVLGCFNFFSFCCYVPVLSWVLSIHTPRYLKTFLLYIFVIANGFLRSLHKSTNWNWKAVLMKEWIAAVIKTLDLIGFWLCSNRTIVYWRRWRFFTFSSCDAISYFRLSTSECGRIFKLLISSMRRFKSFGIIVMRKTLIFSDWQNPLIKILGFIQGRQKLFVLKVFFVKEKHERKCREKRKKQWIFFRNWSRMTQQES